jgi:hypothetical protein
MRKRSRNSFETARPVVVREPGYGVSADLMKTIDELHQRYVDRYAALQEAAIRPPILTTSPVPNYAMRFTVGKMV